MAFLHHFVIRFVSPILYFHNPITNQPQMVSHSYTQLILIIKIPHLLKSLFSQTKQIMSNTPQTLNNDPEYQPSIKQQNRSIFNTFLVKIFLMSCGLLLCIVQVYSVFYEGVILENNPHKRSLLRQDRVRPDSYPQVHESVWWWPFRRTRSIKTKPHIEGTSSDKFTIWFMRHAQTIQNEKDEMAGLDIFEKRIKQLEKGYLSHMHQDVELGSVGRLQVQRLKTYFHHNRQWLHDHGFNFDCTDGNVVVSTLGRAQATAAFLLDGFCDGEHEYNVQLLEMIKEITSGAASKSALTSQPKLDFTRMGEYHDPSPRTLVASLSRIRSGARYRRYLYKRFGGKNVVIPKRGTPERYPYDVLSRFANNPTMSINPTKQAWRDKAKLNQFAQYIYSHQYDHLVVGHGHWAQQAIKQFGGLREDVPGNPCYVGNRHVFYHKEGEQVANTQLIRITAYFADMDDWRTLQFDNCRSLYSYDPDYDRNYREWLTVMRRAERVRNRWVD
eukprot:114898_1